MPNGDTQAGLDREGFARAWATGDEMERGRMIFDLSRHGVEAKQFVKKNLWIIYGGIAVLSVIGGPILLSVFNVVGQ